MNRNTLRYIYLSILLLFAAPCIAQQMSILELPHQEQLSANRVLHIIEDQEGFLWYATEGGGICRQDGSQTDIFRSNAKQPDLLGSNNVACLADVDGSIVIGTFHGAYVLDKKTYSIRALNMVDSKRIDDICKTSDEHYWLTSNQKLYEFSHNHQLLNTFPSQWKGENKYVSDIFEDSHQQLWVTQWSGGLLRFNSKSNRFEEAPWSLQVPPSCIAEDTIHHCLWIGTIGQGIVKYDTKSGSIITQPQELPTRASSQSFVCIDLKFDAKRQLLWMTSTEDLLLFDTSNGTLRQQSLSNILPTSIKALNKISFDKRGNLLVAGNQPGPFAIKLSSEVPYSHNNIIDGNYLWQYQERRGVIVKDLLNGKEITMGNGRAPLLPIMEKRKGEPGIWTTDGNNLLYCTVDSIQIAAVLPNRAEALADDGKGKVWLSTGKELQCVNIQTKEVKTISPNANDISALSFTADGKLWLGNIYGQLYQYVDGKLVLDEYGSNEYGDAIIDLNVDSIGRLVIAYEHYTRFYDTKKHTLTQESMCAEDTYSIILNETKPFSKWTSPQRNIILERLPKWLNSWWMWCIYIAILVAIAFFIYQYQKLRKLRRLFMKSMKQGVEGKQQEKEHLQEANISASDQEWLKQAIATVEKNISNENYTMEQLSNDMFMSRMTFYRKLQSLTGQKPTEFVRTIRLKQAAALLKEGKMNIKEISFATGFSSVSYFSRCFRTMFGVPPTQFGKTTTADSLEPNDTPS